MKYDKPIDAKIVGVYEDCGNRVYRLQTAEPIGKTAYVKLNFDKCPDERQMFFEVQDDGTVLVNAHDCPTPEMPSDGYYCWQRRGITRNRMATTCPRCHRRLDVKPMAHVDADENSDKKE